MTDAARRDRPDAAPRVPADAARHVPSDAARFADPGSAENHESTAAAGRRGVRVRATTMTARRGSDVSVGAVAVLITVLAALTASGWMLGAALAAVGAFVALWFAVGRRAASDIRAARIFIPALIVVSALGAAIFPSFAFVQVVGFPLIWVLCRSIRNAVIGNVVLTVAVATAFVVSLGTSPDALTQILVLQPAALAFSLAMGFWITGIESTSSRRQQLVDELRAAQARIEVLGRDAGMLGERERLAREIHDTIAQDLTGLVMLAQRIRRELGGDRAALAASVDLLEENARAALAETRGLVASTSPVALGDGGLALALGRLADRFERETGVTVSVDLGAVALDRDAEVVLLRIAQEALANVRKHAGADAAEVVLRAADDTPAVIFRIRDDGAGFDPAAPSTGFGIAGMRQRLALVGGSLTIDGRDGTTLTATLPTSVVATAPPADAGAGSAAWTDATSPTSALPTDATPPTSAPPTDAAASTSATPTPASPPTSATPTPASSAGAAPPTPAAPTDATPPTSASPPLTTSEARR